MPSAARYSIICSMGIENKRNRSACPYCGVVIDPPPRRKKACPECKKDIYIRTKQDIVDSDLVTWEQALAIDFYDELQYIGATKQDFYQMKIKLKNKWSIEPSTGDVVWGVSNQLLSRGPSVINPHDPIRDRLYHAKSIVYAQASYQFSSGKDPKLYLEAVANYGIDLLAGIRWPQREIEILANACCENCKKINGKRILTSEAKQLKILPVKNCTNKTRKTDKYSWCSCSYVSISVLE